MADITIPQLKSATSVSGTDVMVISQAGVTKKVEVDKLLSGVRSDLSNISDKVENLSLSVDGSTETSLTSYVTDNNNVFEYIFIKGINYVITSNYPISFGQTIDGEGNVIDSFDGSKSRWEFIATNKAYQFKCYIGSSATNINIIASRNDGIKNEITNIEEEQQILATDITQLSGEVDLIKLGSTGYKIQKTVIDGSSNELDFNLKSGNSYVFKNLHSSSSFVLFLNTIDGQESLGLLNPNWEKTYTASKDGSLTAYCNGTEIYLNISFKNNYSSRLNVLENEVFNGIDINVSSDGTKDFIDIVSAVNHANSLTGYTEKNIILWDSYNDVYAALGGDAWAAQRATLPESNRQNEGLRLEDHVNLIGKNKETIVAFYVSDDYSNEFASCVNPLGNNTLKNIRFTAKNCRYACHDELFGTVDGFTRIVENCTFEMVGYVGTRNSSAQAYGCGSGTNCRYEFKDVIFKTYGVNNNFFIHTNYNINPIRVSMVNCFAEGGNNVFMFSSYGTTDNSNSIAFIGHTNAQIVTRLETPESVNMWEIKH